MFAFYWKLEFNEITPRSV